MNEIAIYGLMCRYPRLKPFIIKCVKEKNLNKLFDFLHSLDIKTEKLYLDKEA